VRPRTIFILACAFGGVVAAAPASAERLPVSSRDDQAESLANRISAVTSVVATMDARLQRIEPSLPPNPIVPPSPIYPALVSVQAAAAAVLASSGALACGTPVLDGEAGGETIADDDSRAEDLSSEGIVEQLNTVATVLAQANGRLIGVAHLVGPTAGSPETDAATAVWAEAAAIFNHTAALLANANETPPSPVCPAG
jgi:hypothetical protein